MSEPPTPPLELTAARCERIDAERIQLRLLGTWRDVPSGTPRLMLVIEADGRRHRFPVVPHPRQAVGAGAPALDARFVLPAALENELDGHITLLVGDDEVAVPPVEGRTVELAPPAAAEAPPDDAPPAATEPPAPQEDLLAPVRAELGERARTEVRLRAEIATLRARVESRGAADERLEEVSQALEAELNRVREAMAEHEGRRSELESKAMVLAADLDEARGRIAELEATTTALGGERDRLSEQVRELEAELTAARHEAVALRTAELSARAAQEAALAQVDALHDEVERLAAEAAGAMRGAGGGGDEELHRAEALLAQARSLTESLG